MKDMQRHFVRFVVAGLFILVLILASLGQWGGASAWAHPPIPMWLLADADGNYCLLVSFQQPGRQAAMNKCSPHVDFAGDAVCRAYVYGDNTWACDNLLKSKYDGIRLSYAKLLPVWGAHMADSNCSEIKCIGDGYPGPMPSIIHFDMKLDALDKLCK